MQKVIKLFIFLILLIDFGCKIKDSNPTLSPVIEQNLFNLINLYRIDNNLNPLIWNEPIAVESRTHSNNMKNNLISFGHGEFAERVKNLQKIYQIKNITENIGFIAGYENISERIFNNWITSSVHNKAILGDFELTGIGVAISDAKEVYITQIFIQIL